MVTKTQLEISELLGDMTMTTCGGVGGGGLLDRGSGGRWVRCAEKGYEELREVL